MITTLNYKTRQLGGYLWLLLCYYTGWSARRKMLERIASTIACLAADMVQKAKSGHPGMPMGAAKIGAVLTQHLSFSPKNGKWIGRDKLILSAGHGSSWLYSILHLFGFLELDDLKQFRQKGSKTPGHPEYDQALGIEATTGPLGQGIGNAIGHAIWSCFVTAKFGLQGLNWWVSRYVYCVAGDGDFMEGVSSEASRIAGRLKLGNLIVIYDSNDISIDGTAQIDYRAVIQQYRANGWHVLLINGQDVIAIDNAIKRAKAVTDKPSLIVARTTIGYGAPKAGSSATHGAPLGDEDLAAAKTALGMPADEFFYVPEEVDNHFLNLTGQRKSEAEAWGREFSAWELDNKTLAEEFLKLTKGDIPENFTRELVTRMDAKFKGEKVATRKLLAFGTDVAGELLPGFISGSLDLNGSTGALISDESELTADNKSGRNLKGGVTEFGLATIINGLGQAGGVIPTLSTFLMFAQYQIAAIRLAALSKVRTLYFFTHDSVGVGEDGPTHQPVEVHWELRGIPGLNYWRPGTPLEAAVAIAQGVERKDGPSAYAFSRQGVDFSLLEGIKVNLADVKKGAYVLWESDPGETPDLILVATGTEVMLALDAARLLSTPPSSLKIRVVSVPCVDLLSQMDKDERAKLFGNDLDTPPALVTVEAGTTRGWAETVGRNAEDDSFLAVGIDSFGFSAPGAEVLDHFELTPESFLPVVRKWQG